MSREPEFFDFAGGKVRIERTAEGAQSRCADCCDHPTRICPRCHRWVCTAHDVTHAQFRQTHGRCYYGLRQDCAAMGTEPPAAALFRPEVNGCRHH